MNINNDRSFLALDIVKMTAEYARQISHWKYDKPYSLYNHSESSVAELMDGEHFACLTTGGELAGYLSFGKDARIPTVEEDVYDDGFLDIGIGLRPDICGRGYGLSFLQCGLAFAKTHYGIRRFRLSVASFNERAIKVYARAGFVLMREVTHAKFPMKFLIKILRYAQDDSVGLGASVGLS